MENKSNSLVNLTVICQHGRQSPSFVPRKSSHSSSLPNLHTSQEEDHHHSCCSPCSTKPVTTPSSNHKVIPHLLQKTWNKIKSMNSKKPTITSLSTTTNLSASSSSSAIHNNNLRPTNSAPSTPNSLQKFDDEEMFEFDPVQENYAKLQKRLSEELHQGQIQIGKNSNSKSNSGHNNCNVSGEFKKKLIQWEMWKASCGKAHYTDEELKLILPEDFSKKLKEWESIRSGSPCPTTNVKIEKQIQWLDKQLEKVEREKGKLEVQMRKFLEKEARLQTMKETLKNYPRDNPNVLIKIKTANAEGFASGVDEKFTKKLYEWEEMRGIRANDGSMALLNPKYYQPVGSSSTSSELRSEESEDIHFSTHLTSHDEPEQNTPVSSSSLESINDNDKASGSNTSNTSADFYQKSRRRSSDSTPLSARSPSLSAFTSEDDEDNPGLLKTVQEDVEAEKQLEPAPTPPVVRVNQIVVEEEESDLMYPSNAIVPTKRTLIKPIVIENLMTTSTVSPTPSSSILQDLHSPSLVKCASGTTTVSTNTATCSNLNNSSSSSFSDSNNQGQVTYARKISPTSPTPTSPTSKPRVEDIWNKNIDSSPPPMRDAPRVVGFIPKNNNPIISKNLPPLPTSTASSSSNSSSAMVITSMSMNINMNPNTNSHVTGMGTTTATSSFNSGFTGSYVQKPLFQHHDGGLRNFPRMGKAPVWVSPLVARRRLQSSSSCMNYGESGMTNSSTASSTATTTPPTSYSLSSSPLSLSTLSAFKGQSRQLNNNSEFSLDRFLETSNLSSALAASSSMNTTNISVNSISSSATSAMCPSSPLLSRASGAEGGPVRLINLSRSSSFGMTKLPSSQPVVEEEDEETVPLSSKVSKSKSTSSVFKSSLNLFNKVMKSADKSENSSSASGSSSKKSLFLGNRWRAQF